MKKIAMLIFTFLIALSMTGCKNKTTTKKTRMFGSTTTSSTTNNYGSSNSTTLTTKATTTTTMTTTKGDDIYDGYYKMNSINYTYHDLGLDNNMYIWHFINSVGEQNILVVPVKIQGTTSVTTQSTIDDLETTLFGDPEVDTNLYSESLKSYYYKSSYEKLILGGEITDWMGNYEKSTFEMLEGQESDPLQTLNDDFESFIATQNIDKSKYDKDKDGYLDCVIFVYSCKDAQQDRSANGNYWAYTCSFENKSNTSNPTLCNYIWLSYDFMYSEEANGKLDAHTFIHEFGHALGQDDFYNGSESNIQQKDVTGQNIMMAYNVCDHDAFTKFSYGWINPYVVTGNCSITINPFQESGDAIILPIIDSSVKSFDKNAFSEYIILEYYTPTGLNEKDSKTAYGNLRGITGSGIRVYYVDARLFYEINEEEVQIVDYRYEYNKTMGNGLVVARTNNPDNCMYLESEQDMKLMQLMDASARVRNNKIDFFNKSTSATTSQLFKNGSTLNTRYYYFNSKPTSRYTISFTLNSDNTYTITFAKNS